MPSHREGVPSRQEDQVLEVLLYDVKDFLPIFETTRSSRNTAAFTATAALTQNMYKF